MAVEGFARRKRRLGDWLISERAISPEQLEKALEVKKHSEKKLGEIIIDLGFVSEEVMVDVLARKLNFEKVTPTSMKISEEVQALVGAQILRKHVMIPFEFKAGSNNTLRVAMADPLDMNAMDDLMMITNLRI